jgi:RNA polymerase sigma factor (sigma-70 family)
MTEPLSDRELLRQYAQAGEEGAFKALVARHVDLVYATAVRGLSDSAVAQEVTQNVFILLARKGFWLGGEICLAAWLHRSTQLEVKRWWRGEFRRQRREQTAAELGTLMKDDASLLKALEDELDEGLLTLSEADRTALLLRYFEGRSHRDIGGLLGAREDAVRMRIGRALECYALFCHRIFGRIDIAKPSKNGPSGRKNRR